MQTSHGPTDRARALASAQLAASITSRAPIAVSRLTMDSRTNGWSSTTIAVKPAEFPGWGGTCSANAVTLVPPLLVEVGLPDPVSPGVIGCGGRGLKHSPTLACCIRGNRLSVICRGARPGDT